MPYNSRHTGAEIDDAVDRILEHNYAEVSSSNVLLNSLMAMTTTDLDTAQVRNIRMGTTAMQDGVTPLNTGEIYIQYTN